MEEAIESLNHQQSVTPTPSNMKNGVCVKCKKNATSANTLDTIFLLHCDECFTRMREEMNFSWRLEMEENLNSCEVCWDTFVNKWPKKPHNCTKDGEYCSLCGVQFSNEDSVVEHLIQVHGEIYEVPIITLGSDVEDECRADEIKTCVCLLCKQVLPSHGRLIAHLRADHKDSKYICEFCHIEYANYGNLKRHSAIHTGVRPFACKICRKGFLESSSLQRHMFVHTGQKRFYCTMCEKGFVAKHQLAKHELIAHKFVDPSRYECKICKKGFSTKEGLANHRLIHVPEKKFACRICRKRFAQNNLLVLHMHSHNGEKPHACDDCKKGFKRYGTFLKHHCIPQSEKFYFCRFCDKSFALRGNFVKHLSTHKIDNKTTTESTTKRFNQQLINCTVCEQIFKKYNEFVAHVLKHSNGNSYKCTVCQEIFTKSGEFTIHLYTHNTQNENYVCTVCEQSLTDHDEFVTHLLAHDLEKPFTCTVCNKSFSRNGDFIKHQQIHTGVERYTQDTTTVPVKKPYCTACNRHFKRYYDFIRHRCPKSYKCTVCDRRFTQEQDLELHCCIRQVNGTSTGTGKTFSDLKRHTTVHKQLRRGRKTTKKLFKCNEQQAFVCAVCKKSFTKRYNLYAHQYRHQTSQ